MRQVRRVDKFNPSELAIYDEIDFGEPYLQTHRSVNTVVVGGGEFELSLGSKLPQKKYNKSKH